MGHRVGTPIQQGRSFYRKTAFPETSRPGAAPDRQLSIPAPPSGSLFVS